MRQSRSLVVGSVVIFALVGGCAQQQPSASGQSLQPGQRVVQVSSPRKIEVPPPPPVKRVAMDAGLREQARKELETALEARQPVVRAHAVEGLKEALGSAAGPTIVRMLNDSDPVVRFAAAMAAGEVRVGAAMQRVRQLVADQDPHVRVAAVFAMHRMGDTSRSHLLEEALTHQSQWVRSNAVIALGRLGEPSAVKVLYRVLFEDQVAEVRLQAAEALWRLGNEEGLKSLVAATLSRNPAHQIIGFQALASRREERVIEHVRAGLDSEYMEIILVTARSLGMLGSDEAYSAAVTGSKSEDVRQRQLAALALGAIGRSDAQPALSPLLKDLDQDVRVAAAVAVLQLREPSAGVAATTR